MTEKNLCIVTGKLIIAEEVFTDGGAEELLKPLRLALKQFVPDITTAKGRKEIASFAAKFSKSKTLVDGLGKGLKDAYSVKIKPIDKERKIFRDECDLMKAEARKPLALWEEEQEKIVEAEREKVQLELEAEEAARLKAIEDREKEIERKEAEFAKIEADKIAKEEAEKLEKEQAEREERIKKEAAEQAIKDTEEKARKEKEESDRLVQEVVEREKQLKLDIKNEAIRLEQEAFERESEIEAEKLAAKQKAEREKQEALDLQRRQQEENEKAEHARVAEEKRIEERKAANRNHQKAVNRSALKKLMSFHGCNMSLTEEHAQAIIKDLIQYPIPEITINY